MVPPAGGRALDLGRGAGRHAVLLADRFAHVDAIDLSLPMIEIARARRPRPGVAYQQADLLNLAGRGPATAWEIYRLQTRRAWLDHLVSDRFFSREELDQCCAALFPGCRLDRLGGTVVGLTWDSTPVETR